MEKVISSFNGILEIFISFLVVGVYLFSVSEELRIGSSKELT